MVACMFVTVDVLTLIGSVEKRAELDCVYGIVPDPTALTFRRTRNSNISYSSAQLTSQNL